MKKASHVLALFLYIGEMDTEHSAELENRQVQKVRRNVLQTDRYLERDGIRHFS